MSVNEGINKFYQQINELRAKLHNSDYKAIKFAEGELTTEEFEPIKQQRKIWRSEINRLEKDIAFAENTTPSISERIETISNILKEGEENAANNHDAQQDGNI